MKRSAAFQLDIAGQSWGTTRACSLAEYRCEVVFLQALTQKGDLAVTFFMGVNQSAEYFFSKRSGEV